MCLACGVLVGLTGSARCGSRGWMYVLFFSLFPRQYPIGQMPAPRGFGLVMPPCQQPASFSCLARCPMTVSSFNAVAGYGCIQCVVSCRKQYPFSLAKLASQAVAALMYSGEREKRVTKGRLGETAAQTSPPL
jgi:hypothetical protein